MPRRKKNNVEKPKLGRGDIVREEELPYPIVHYPRWGPFFAFAKDEKSTPALCACSKQAAINAVKIREMICGVQEYEDLGDAPLSDALFPDVIAEQSLKDFKDPFSTITFIDGLCHKCNSRIPSLLYHTYYRDFSEFYQYFGWYVDQTYYQFGIEPLSPLFIGRGSSPITYIESECPQEYLDIIREHNTLFDEYSFDLEFVDSENKSKEARQLARKHHDIRLKMDKLQRILHYKIYGLTQYKLKYIKVGENLQGETQLYKVICELFPDNEVRRHYKDVWLEGLILDIYIPDMKLAFEYQGKQHYKPIDFFGGVSVLEENQLRDEQKAELCGGNGVNLILIDYDEPLTIENIRNKLIDNDESYKSIIQEHSKTAIEKQEMEQKATLKATTTEDRKNSMKKKRLPHRIRKQLKETENQDTKVRMTKIKSSPKNKELSLRIINLLEENKNINVK
jgi:hypothetical protein